MSKQIKGRYRFNTLKEFDLEFAAAIEDRDLYKKEVFDAQAQIKHLGDCLAQTTSLVQTQDGEIGRLTTLNDRMFAIIDKLITHDRT